MRFGQHHDSPDRRYGHTDPQTGDEAPRCQGQERGAERGQHQTGHIQCQPDHDQAPGVAAVGHGGNGHRCQEAGEEPQADDNSQGAFADAVLVAVVVEQREQHTMTGGHGCRQEEKRSQRTATGGARHEEGVRCVR
jgi:hypothetical protein